MWPSSLRPFCALCQPDRHRPPEAPRRLTCAFSTPCRSRSGSWCWYEGSGGKKAARRHTWFFSPGRVRRHGSSAPAPASHMGRCQWSAKWGVKSSWGEGSRRRVEEREPPCCCCPSWCHRHRPDGRGPSMHDPGGERHETGDTRQPWRRGPENGAGNSRPERKETGDLDSWRS